MTNRPYTWVVNAGQGMRVGDAGTFFATMQFRVIDTHPASNDASQSFRVSTLGYLYNLEGTDGTAAWRIHWHRDSVSPVTEPHLHFPPNLKLHYACERMTFEIAIRWCIEAGAPVRHSADVALQELAVTEAPHLLHRSWTSPLDPGYLEATQAGRP